MIGTPRVRDTLQGGQSLEEKSQKEQLLWVEGRHEESRAGCEFRMNRKKIGGEGWSQVLRTSK